MSEHEELERRWGNGSAGQWHFVRAASKHCGHAAEGCAGQMGCARWKNVRQRVQGGWDMRRQGV